MRASKYLFTYKDVTDEQSGFTNTTYGNPFLKPGRTSSIGTSNKCMTWNEVKQYLLWNQGFSETQLPTWDDILNYTNYHSVSGYFDNTDAWGFAWTHWYLSLYTTTPPHTSNARNINLNVNSGQAAVVVKYYISSTWWSGTNTHHEFVCKRKSSNAVFYSCLNDTRPYNTDCGQYTTTGNLDRTSGSVTPKGCILALVPYGEWIEEDYVADNVGGSDGRVSYAFEWYVVPWPY